MTKAKAAARKSAKRASAVVGGHRVGGAGRHVIEESPLSFLALIGVIVQLAALDVPAADAWMVGDNLEWDVAGPQREGITGIWIDARRTGVPNGHAVRPDRIINRLADLRSETR